MVVVVEVTRKAYLASVVPVIVDAILNEHQVIVDIVAFVSQGDFPRSRLGEKQRGKVLASWVTRKLRTVAQFSIRDVEGPENPLAETPLHRMSRSSKPGSTMGNSMRRSTMVPENDPVPPRSPAPVLEEHPQPVAHDAYEEQEHREGPSAVPTVQPVSETITAIPQIAEPTAPAPAPPASTMAPTTDHEYQQGRDDSPTAIEQPDLGFNFGDFTHTAGTPQEEPEQPQPTFEAESLPFRDAKGRNSLPSQRRFSSMPAGAEFLAERPGSRDVKSQPDTVEEDVEDWPQEALMYQSTMGNDDGHGYGHGDAHAAPGSYSGFAKTTRYDGSDYGY